MIERSWDASFWIRENWFYVIATITIAFDLAVVQFAGWGAPRANELALLFDFAIQTPFLYWLCYRSRGSKAILGAVAIACLALWALGHIIPTEHQDLLVKFAWARPLGLAVVILLELKVVALVWKAVFVGNSSQGEVEKKLTQDGTPPWVARLLATEATFWKKAWSLIRKIVGRRR